MENKKMITLSSYAKEKGINKSKLQFYLKLGLLGKPIQNIGIMIFDYNSLDNNYKKIESEKNKGKKLGDIKI